MAENEINESEYLLELVHNNNNGDAFLTFVNFFLCSVKKDIN